MKKTLAVCSVGVLVGCGILAPTLDQKGIVRVNISKSSPIHVVYASVYEEDDKMVVRGKVQYPISIRYGTFGGHVDVTVIKPNGKRLEDHDVKLVRHRIPRTMGRVAFFTTSFSLDPPPNTVVQVAYNESNHKKSN